MPSVDDDFERILEHLLTHDSHAAPDRVEQIIDALQVLTHSPGIGRRLRPGKPERELVIGKGYRGYVAVYRHDALVDTVFVLSLRSQRESAR